jgi:hypothetical protein
LDRSISKIRVILLVGIGREGWDCKSLTGVILSQENDCPKNMVLQTCCRCLRQVTRNEVESARVYLNADNAKLLDEQLKNEHRVTLSEFQTGKEKHPGKISVYDRRKHLKLESLNYYQLEVEMNTIVDESLLNIVGVLNNICLQIFEPQYHVTYIDIVDGIVRDDEEILCQRGNIAIFNQWLYSIEKESFGFIKKEQLNVYRIPLLQIFEKITIYEDGITYFNRNLNIFEIGSQIRKSFCPYRRFEVKHELIGEKAELLNVGNFESEKYVSDINKYCPDETRVQSIINADLGNIMIDENTKLLLKAA